MTSIPEEQKYQVKELSRNEILEIYRDTAPAHFPADELKPVSIIETLISKDAYIGLGLVDGDERLLGYALFLTIPNLDVILLDYYAILTSYRDLGLGSLFLSKMKSFFHKYQGILIETEDIDCSANEMEYKERTRRNEFYRKNGAILTNLRCALYDVPFTIFYLATPSHTASKNTKNSILELECTPLEQPVLNLQEKLDAIYRFMLSEKDYAKYVKWR